MSVLEVSQLQKIYKSRFSATQVEALKKVSFKAEEGEFVAIMGESGSGKTTLLNILAALDRPTSGEVKIEGRDAAKISQRELASFRRRHLGFLFQDYSLLDTFTNKDNILLPLVLNGEKIGDMEAALRPLAKRLGITDILNKYPYEISGGQKQRVAAARALITGAELLLADEPTGALDSKSSQELLDMFEQLNQQGQTIVMVTHSTGAASYASRVLYMRDGKLIWEMDRRNASREQFFDALSRQLLKKPEADRV